MTLLIPAVLEVGAAATKHILKLWLGNSSLGDEIGASLVDLLKLKTSDVIAQRKGERQFAELGNQIGESLLPLFEREGNFDEGDYIAVAYAAKEAFEQAKLSTTLLIQRNLEPTVLAQFVLDAYPVPTYSFGEAATELYRRIIHETCTYIVDIASQLPKFTERGFAEVLKPENQIISIGEATLAELRKIREHLDPMVEAERFEIEYRQAVARNLDILQLIGADVSLPNRRHRLSVAYITLSVEQKQPTLSGLEAILNGESDQEEIRKVVPVHAALARSHRILIRGLPGSGKTTLLQWVAVQSCNEII